MNRYGGLAFVALVGLLGALSTTVVEPEANALPLAFALGEESVDSLSGTGSLF